MEITEVFKHLFLLAHSLTGRHKSAKGLLAECLAYSDQIQDYLARKKPIELNYHEISDLEEFLLSFYHKRNFNKDLPNKSPDLATFYQLSAKQRVLLTKFKQENIETPELLKRDYSEALCAYGKLLKLETFQEIPREKVKCALTRSALVRLLMQKESLNFKEHAGNCHSCSLFEKKLRMDLIHLNKSIPVDSISQDEVDDIIFSLKYPSDDYAYIALDKIKRAGRNLSNYFKS